MGERKMHCGFSGFRARNFIVKTRQGLVGHDCQHPVVPQGQARVRCQISAAHSRDDLEQALTAFAKVGRQLRLI
jgi:7-keto-8-aminopelargonate synthetase-like enzyme